MKKHILYIVALCGLLFVGCCTEEEIDTPQKGNDTPFALALQVEAEGYSSSTGTRASESELTTSFAIGDQLALIIDYESGSPEHVIYTYGSTGWTTSATVYYDPKASYSAYYPYQKGMTGKTLEEIKEAFTPKEDQSDYATGYAASDLMACESPMWNKDKKNLQITLSHQFILLRMERISMTCTCDGRGYQFKAPLSNVAFYIDGKPYRPWMEDEEEKYARLIVKSADREIKVACNNVVDNTRIKLDFGHETLSAGQYYNFTFAFDIGPYSFVRIGDYYIQKNESEKYFIPREVDVLDGDIKENCLGVVLKVGRDTDGDWKDDCDYKCKDGSDMPVIQGYVLALHDANNGNTCIWSNNYKSTDEMNKEENTGFYGYKNTIAINKYQESHPATDAIAGYEKSHPAPKKSSGWFLPSSGQCQYWVNNRVIISASVQKITGVNMLERQYWTSSEKAEPRTMAYINQVTSIGFMLKNQGLYYVRACFAF
ncbi:fimbrillin family protein [Parabacteroides timonensis]|uniref:fimbrillin family protein n=1 Tax=Parabacteroides timonensis TaxID=1871013 RepID=UPI00094E9C27|nr:fimbrillin family protein [Parabacteroides timonensis]